VLLAQLFGAFGALRTALELPRRALAAGGYHVLRLQEGPRETERIERRSTRQLPQAIQLGPESAHSVSLKPARDIHVRCTAGAVWLTRDGDIEDYVLAAGAGQCVRRGRQVVVVGMPRGAIEIRLASADELAGVD